MTEPAPYRLPGDVVLVMLPARVLGWLVAHAINQALEEPVGGDGPEPCCPECCGPCAALHWLRHNAPDTAACAVALHSPASDTTGYDWQTSDDGIDWARLEAVWARAGELQCH